MNRIIFATGNAGKMKEIREILGDMDAEILSMKEAGIQTDIVENGTTFEENARIKAKAVAQFTKDIVLADDSGLEVDYLNKASMMTDDFSIPFLLMSFTMRELYNPRAAP